MRYINERYADEAYWKDGSLAAYKLKYPDNFNFAYDIADDIADNDPNRTAMVWCKPDAETIKFSFLDMKLLSNRAANYLKSLGISKGDGVIVALKRHWQFWIVALALEKLGAVMIPVTFMLKAHDAEYRVTASGCKAVISTADGETAEAFDGLTGEHGELTRILVTSGENVPMKDGWLNFNAELKNAPADWETFKRIDTNVSDPMLMYFSSGTSGQPKMVLHSHKYALGHLLGAKHWHNLKADGLHFTIADTGWGKAVWGKFYGQWMMESAVLTYDYDTFKAEEILGVISEQKVTTLCCPPTMYRMLLKEDFAKYDLSALVYATTAGEALNPDVFVDFKERTGITIMEGFGQTETTVVLCNLPGTTPRPGSIGKPSPQYQVELQNSDGTPCKPGETGEIVIRAVEGHFPEGLMDCYYRDEAKTNEAIHDGWYHTGDTAWRDEEGYYYFEGRNDDIIKSSGYRIGPTEIESVLVTHPAVSECAITGVPDTTGVRGQLVKATVVLNPGFAASDELIKEMQNFVKAETAPYKYPRIIEFVDKLPRTVNGKIRRVELRDKSKPAEFTPDN
ncbi:MAG: AMP-binding protein [Oscillospiraceae bacterium]|jgi:acetyl-CoA synthetase|nr:AMP-binding protein [Oscillospiraceae bacterium]